MSRSESRLAAEFDTTMGEFRDRPLDTGPYRYLWIDPLSQRVHKGGTVVNVSDGDRHGGRCERRREAVWFDIVTTEDTASWTEFLSDVAARGLVSVELVISDAHGGIKSGDRRGAGRSDMKKVSKRISWQIWPAGFRSRRGR
jgi:putative transposase